MNKILQHLKRLRLEFYLDIYVLTIGTSILNIRPVGRSAAEVCRVRVEVFRKKVFEFDLYQVPEWRS